MAAEREGGSRLLENRAVQALLQADGATLGLVLEDLDTKVFQVDGARLIFEAARDVFASTGTLSPEMLATRLGENEVWVKAVGGVEHGPKLIAALAQPDAAVGDLPGHLAMVRSADLRRNISKTAGALANTATSDWTKSQKIIDQLNATSAMVGDPSAETMDLAELAAWGGKVHVFGEEIPTPFSKLNEFLTAAAKGGLPYGSLIAMGARTGFGKSTLLMTFVMFYLMQLRLPLAYLNFEMSEAILSRRIFAGVTKGDPWRHDTYPDFDQKRALFEQVVMGWKARDLLFLRNQGSSSLDAVLGYLRSVTDKGVRVVFIDTVNRIHLPGGKGRPRWEMMIGTLQRLEQFALARDICIICACQANREQDRRRNKRPMLSDLADSSEIEKVAAAVLQLHRPLVKGQNNVYRPISELYITKSRLGGKTGSMCRLKYNDDSRLFEGAEDKRGIEKPGDLEKNNG